MQRWDALLASIHNTSPHVAQAAEDAPVAVLGRGSLSGASNALTSPVMLVPKGGLLGAAAQYGKVVDALQIKEGKAAVITREWLLYLDVRRRRLCWAIKMAHLATTSTHGLVVVVHYSVRLSFGASSTIRLAARRRVSCPSKETCQALCSRLERAMATRVATAEADRDLAAGTAIVTVDGDAARGPRPTRDLHILPTLEQRLPRQPIDDETDSRPLHQALRSACLLPTTRPRVLQLPSPAPHGNGVSPEQPQSDGALSGRQVDIQPESGHGIDVALFGGGGEAVSGGRASMRSTSPFVRLVDAHAQAQLPVRQSTTASDSRRQTHMTHDSTGGFTSAVTSGSKDTAATHIVTDGNSHTTPEEGGQLTAMPAALQAVCVLCECVMAAEAAAQAESLLSSIAIVSQAALQGGTAGDTFSAILSMCNSSRHNAISTHGARQIAAAIKTLCRAQNAVQS